MPVKGRDANLVLKVEERLKELIAAGFEVKRIDATRSKPKQTARLAALRPPPPLDIAKKGEGPDRMYA
jgi:hypothetical protein